MDATVRVGIICIGQFGDVAESTGVFKYREELWGKDPEIHWFVSRKFRQVLDHNPHVIVHELVDGNSGRATQYAAEMARDMKLRPYFPAPYMNGVAVVKIPLPRIPSYVFHLDLRGRPWKPQIYLTPQEVNQVKRFMRKAPTGFRIMLETACFSHQGDWPNQLTHRLIAKLQTCNPVLLTASFGEGEKLRAQGVQNVVPLDTMNYRQLTEVYNYCDAFVGIPSGAASVTCAERCKALPRFELLASDRCPAPGKLAPDWGTSAMRPTLHTDDPRILLDNVASAAHNMVRAGYRKGRKSGHKRGSFRRAHKARALHVVPGVG